MQYVPVFIEEVGTLWRGVAGISGGRGGIRTHGTLAGTPVFKTGALNHSATLPSLELSDLAGVRVLGKHELPRNPAAEIKRVRWGASASIAEHCIHRVPARRIS